MEAKKTVKARIAGARDGVTNHFNKYHGLYNTAFGLFLVMKVQGGSFRDGTNIVKPNSINIATRDTINITTEIIRRGNPGIIVRCKETGEVFGSIRRAAEATGVSANSISDCIKGVKNSVKGLSFEAFDVLS